jgi:glycosyltransferase involved in cell wall biosynthesis
MRILQVTLGFLPAEGWGGPVKVVHRTCSELVQRGHQVTVYCTNLFDKKHQIQAGTFERNIDGIRVVYFNTLNFKWWPGTLGPFWLPDLPTFIKKEIRNFDVVHLHGYRSPMFIPLVQAARRAGIPIVTQPHGTLPVKINSFWIKQLYDRLFRKLELEGISTLIALSKSERQYALDVNIPAERIVLVPNGVDPILKNAFPKKGSFRQRLGIGDCTRLILFLGRINRMKGADMLVEAFARLNDSSLQLVIAGPDDGQLIEVTEMVKQRGLCDRVVFTGLLSGSDTLSAFQDADLFVLPSRYDAFPMTIVESCLAGTPMVITDQCEIADLVQDRIGDVVSFDAKEFADAINRLLSDRKRYEQYKLNTQQVLNDTFSIGAVADKIESIYQNVIQKAKA